MLEKIETLKCDHYNCKTRVTIRQILTVRGVTTVKYFCKDHYPKDDKFKKNYEVPEDELARLSSVFPNGQFPIYIGKNDKWSSLAKKKLIATNYLPENLIFLIEDEINSNGLEKIMSDCPNSLSPEIIEKYGINSIKFQGDKTNYLAWEFLDMIVIFTPAGNLGWVLRFDQIYIFPPRNK